MVKEFENSKNALVVNLCGEIDQYAAAELKEKIDIEIENSSRKNLIINLAEVKLMDSSGIGLIVGRYKAIRSLGGNIALCCASPFVRKMIKLSGLEKIIKCYNSISEADKALTISH